jgi:hypothetical protein
MLHDRGEVELRFVGAEVSQHVIGDAALVLEFSKIFLVEQRLLNTRDNSTFLSALTIS